METLKAVIELALIYLGSVGAASSYYIFCKLKEIYDITDDVGVELTAWGFMLMAFGLLIETLVHVAHLYKAVYGSTLNLPLFINIHGNAFCPLPPALFLMAYTLYFSGVYVSNKLGRLALSLAPATLLAGILGEINSLMILMLLLAFIYSFENKNKKFLTFFSILILSHLAAMVGILNARNMFEFLKLAFALRSLAPTVLLYMVMRRKG